MRWQRACGVFLKEYLLSISLLLNQSICICCLTPEWRKSIMHEHFEVNSNMKDSFVPNTQLAVRKKERERDHDVMNRTVEVGSGGRFTGWTVMIAPGFGLPCRFLPPHPSALAFFKFNFLLFKCLKKKRKKSHTKMLYSLADFLGQTRLAPKPELSSILIPSANITLFNL